MLSRLDRLLLVKSDERERLTRLRIPPAEARTENTHHDWLEEWHSALTETEHAIQDWQSYIEQQPIEAEGGGEAGAETEAEAELQQFLQVAEEQSAEFDEQMKRYAEGHLSGISRTMLEPAKAAPEPLTGEGDWSSSFDTKDRPVPIGGHQLPPLPYPYNALEPHIDEQTMRIHHDKHHQSYVDGLNKAEKKMAEARKRNDFDLIKHWEREAAFNGAGHYLHTIFWNIMSPDGGGKPTGKLAEQIDKDFGSFDAFKRHFSQAAEKVEGGGWAILVWSPRSHRLEILQAEKHQNLSQWDNVPLLVLDVWEHAYYLKHQNKRADYINAWWNTVNWPHVQERYESARRLKWEPY